MRSGRSCNTAAVRASEARASLARTAAVLQLRPERMGEVARLAADTPGDRAGHVEQTSWGPAARLLPPVEIEGVPLAWRYPARALGTYAPEWLSSNEEL